MLTLPPPRLTVIPPFNTPVDDSWEWEGQSLRLGQQPKSNEQDGNNLDRYWTRRTGRCLTKCTIISNYIVRPAATPADLS
jgi:hypothetical protein